MTKVKSKVQPSPSTEGVVYITARVIKEHDGLKVGMTLKHKKAIVDMMVAKKLWEYVKKT